MERDFGLTIVRNERDPEQLTRAPGRNEFEQARRLDTDLKAIRETIRECWDRSDNGQSFNAALQQEGMILARGDRRDFVIIDAEGGDHALSKRITGATMAETRARMTDIDRGQLPSVDMAKEMQIERAQERAPELQSREPGATTGPVKEIASPRPGPDRSEAAEISREAKPVLESMRDAGDAISGAGEAAAGSLMVAGDAIGRPAEKLVSFVEGLLDSLIGGGAPPRKISATEYMDNPEARRDYVAQQQAGRASDEAIDRMRRSIDAGKTLRPEDVRLLTHDHLLNLKSKGDAYMQEMIADRERDEARSPGRERER